MAELSPPGGPAYVSYGELEAYRRMAAEYLDGKNTSPQRVRELAAGMQAVVDDSLFARRRSAELLHPTDEDAPTMLLRCAWSTLELPWSCLESLKQFNFADDVRKARRLILLALRRLGFTGYGLPESEGGEGLDKAARTNAELRQRVADLEQEVEHQRRLASQAVAEANRTSDKWKAGIVHACGTEIEFGIASFERRHVPTLGQFVRGMTDECHRLRNALLACKAYAEGADPMKEECQNCATILRRATAALDGTDE